MKKIVLFVLSILILISSTLFGSDITVYTYRPAEADQKLYNQFTEKTGIKVTVISVKSDELLALLQDGGSMNSADIIVANDAGDIQAIKEAGLLQPVKSRILKKIVPKKLRDKDNHWFGLTKRARVIVYNPENIQPGDLSTYEDLSDFRWHKKVVMTTAADSRNRSLLASFIHHYGEKKASLWADTLKYHLVRKPTASDTDKIKAVADGTGAVTIVNSNTLARLCASSDPDEKSIGNGVRVYFPNQPKADAVTKATVKTKYGNKNFDRGTHITISAAGITKSSKQAKNAVMLLEYLVSKEVQEELSNITLDYPINPKAKRADILATWGDFREDKTSITELITYLKDAAKIFKNGRWE